MAITADAPRGGVVEEIDGVLGQVGGENLVVVIHEQTGYAVAHGLIVLDNENRLPIAGRQIGSRSQGAFVFFSSLYRRDLGQKDAKSRSFADFAG